MTMMMINLYHHQVHQREFARRYKNMKKVLGCWVLNYDQLSKQLKRLLIGFFIILIDQEYLLLLYM